VRLPFLPWALFAAGFAAAVALVLTHVLPGSQETFVRSWGYYAITATGALFAASIVPCLPAIARARAAFTSGDLALVVAAFAFLTASSPWQFKTLMDEGVILGISKQMHMAREASVPTVSTSSPSGGPRLTSGYVDKRPLLQPALVSVLHDLTGYRPFNAIVVNVAVALFFVAGSWYLGFQIAGTAGGRASALMWSSVPLLSMSATSGGLELVNLTLVVAVTLLAIAFLQAPSPRRMAPLVFGGLLLAQARYESAVFLLPVLVIVAIGWTRSREIYLPWLLVPTPLLVVPYYFTRLLASGPAWTWEVYERTGSNAHFALSYAPQNLRNAIEYFCDTSLRHANSLLAVALGVGLAPLAYRQLRAMLQRGEGPRTTAIALTSMATAAAVLFPVIMCYYWADFRDPAAARLALVLYFPLVVSALLGLAWLGERIALWPSALALCALFSVLWTSAILAQKSNDELARDTRQWNWLAERIRSSPENTLWVMPTSVWPIVNGRDALSLDSANAEPELIESFLKNGAYQAVYFVEVFRVIMPKAEHVQTDRSKTSSKFVLETVGEFGGQPFWVQRVSRLKEVRL
jgi:hypothetical protein